VPMGIVHVLEVVDVDDPENHSLRIVGLVSRARNLCFRAICLRSGDEAFYRETAEAQTLPAWGRAPPLPALTYRTGFP
jgi:hypothetical protein